MFYIQCNGFSIDTTYDSCTGCVWEEIHHNAINNLLVYNVLCSMSDNFIRDHFPLD